LREGIQVNHDGQWCPKSSLEYILGHKPLIFSFGGKASLDFCHHVWSGHIFDFWDSLCETLLVGQMSNIVHLDFMVIVILR